jgi:hypothetical protein
MSGRERLLGQLRCLGQVMSGTVSGSTFSFQLSTSLVVGHKYSWRVASVSANGTKKWSLALTFTLIPNVRLTRNPAATKPLEAYK